MPEACSKPATPIHELQGAGSRSPKEGERHTVDAVVTARFPGREGLAGFFLQEEPSDADGDPRSSEGIFVFEGGTPIQASVGDRLRISGTVVEFASGESVLTELVEPRDATVCGRGASIPAHAAQLSPSNPMDWESLEGMRVNLEGVVTQTREYARFGSVGLAHERLAEPTQVVPPGDAARLRREQDERARIVLDDASTQGLPELTHRLRSGDRIRLISAIVDERFGDYRIQPTVPLDVTESARSETPPALEGKLRIAGFNVLNWFHTLDTGEPRCGPARNQGCRGATNEAERSQQLRKLGAVLRGLRADVIGLAEIENASPEALEALRAELGPNYRAIETGPLGSDVIRVALLYRAERLTLAGDFAVLDNSVDPEFNDRRNRPVLLQAFETLESGERFAVAVNHWKSKGSVCEGDPDAHDGQGRCNGTRSAAARAILRWLADDPTGSGDPDVLILGDLNSYRLEDPIRTLVSAGYDDLLARFVGPDAYTATFEGRFGALDHALASASLASQVAGAVVWHINADEPRDLAAEENSVFGSSDHDPVLVGLDL